MQKRRSVASAAHRRPTFGSRVRCCRDLQWTESMRQRWPARRRRPSRRRCGPPAQPVSRNTPLLEPARAEHDHFDDAGVDDRGSPGMPRSVGRELEGCPRISRRTVRRSLASASNRLCWAPGCSGSRRTISRVPSGQADRSTRSVTSATAAPGRSSPSWRSAGCHLSSSKATRLMAAWMLALERATHGEADVAGPGVPDEIGAAGRVDTHLHGSTDQRWIVVTAMAGGDLGGELGDRRVEQGDVVGDVVGPRVARPQRHREGLAGGVGEAVDRVELVATLVGGRRLLFVLGVDFVQRGVDVQHDRRGPRRRRRPAPDIGAHLGHRLPQLRQRPGADGSQRPVQRRVGRHGAEQRRLGAQVLDVGARLATAGERRHGLDQDLAPGRGAGAARR